MMKEFEVEVQITFSVPIHVSAENATSAEDIAKTVILHTDAHPLTNISILDVDAFAFPPDKDEVAEVCAEDEPHCCRGCNHYPCGKSSTESEAELASLFFS